MKKNKANCNRLRPEISDFSGFPCLFRNLFINKYIESGHRLNKEAAGLIYCKRD